MRRGEKVTPSPTGLFRPSGRARPGPAGAHGSGGAAVGCQRGRRSVYPGSPSPLYLHTQQTGNGVHLYANVFVPKAGILN